MRSITCFLIDDDPDDQDIFSLAAARLDYPVRCVTAFDGLNAIEQLEADPAFVPDYIFLDLNMPRMDGFQCLSAIKQIDRLRDVPVIIYTTSEEQRDKDKSHDLGCYRFITKPVSISDLQAILNDVFSGAEPQPSC